MFCLRHSAQAEGFAPGNGTGSVAMSAGTETAVAQEDGRKHSYCRGNPSPSHSINYRLPRKYDKLAHLFQEHKYMIDVNQLRRGVSFTQDGNLYKVTEYSHKKPGRGKATIRVNVKDLRTGSNLQLTFTSGDRVEDIRLDKRTYQYLYDDGQFYVFMDTGTYEQKQLPHGVMDEDKHYLRDNMELELLSYEGEVLDYILPKSMEFEVIEAENAVAGDTATGATKTVVTDTGLKV
ncbi:MAG TPA: elongation factor P, partial [Chloroflexi bacterium]|nr:elongation factor P [Chloroflexota bacterium]